MTERSTAYLFHNQQLLVNEQGQLPEVETWANDLIVNTEDRVVLARDWPADHTIPEGLCWQPIRQLIPNWDLTQFMQASRAIQLLEWQRNHGFCSRCGHSTERHSTQHAMICPACQYSQYPRIQPCVITVITRGNNELLLAKGLHHKSMYSLIAGFVEVGESLEQAVQRETLEEVGIRVKNIRYMASQPWPFPSNLMLAFQAEYDSGDIVLQEDELADAQFFKFDDLPEIPFKGSIAYAMIMNVVRHEPMPQQRVDTPSFTA